MDMFSFLLGRSSGGGGKGSLKVLVVEELPETGEANTLYLVPRQVSKYRNVFDEYLWINETWEMVGTTDIDISGKQDKMQFATMPSANADNLGKIYQYIGTTNANYTNGYFYICVSDGGDPATYSWQSISTQEEPIIIEFYRGDSNQTLIEKLQKVKYIYDNNKNYIILMKTNQSSTTCDIRKENDTKYFIYSNVSFDTGYTTKYGIKYHNLRVRDFVLNYTGDTLTSISNSHDNRYSIVPSAGDYPNYTSLGVANTESYTPTGDYNPATKKYVDDSIASAITTTLGGNY